MDDSHRHGLREECPMCWEENEMGRINGIYVPILACKYELIIPHSLCANDYFLALVSDFYGIKVEKISLGKDIDCLLPFSGRFFILLLNIFLK